MFGNILTHNHSTTQSNKNITRSSPDSILPKWDYKIGDWIIEALRKNKRLGRNKIYRDVDKRYKKTRHKTTSLSKDTFDNHLKFLIQNNIVGKDDVGQRGIKIEHFLTQEAKQQLQAGPLNLRALKNNNKKLIKPTPQIKQKALYILILMFNHTTSFEFQNKEAAESFLAQLHLKLYKQSRGRMDDEHESEEARNERRHFQTIFQSSDRCVTVYMNEYINRHDGNTLNAYKCQIRGMTKESVLSNKIGKPFRYLSFSKAQIDKVFDLLCNEDMLHSMPRYDGSQIYRIIDNDLYFLLLFLDDLFTENVMPIMHKIWKYLRNPTAEERKWLTLLEGEKEANIIMIGENEHRREIETGIRHKSSGIETVAATKLREKKTEIAVQVESMLEELDNYLKTYEIIISKHKSLQYIFEIMFPEFLRSLKLR